MIKPGTRQLGTAPTPLPLTQNIILLRYGNRNLVVAGNGGNIFSNGLGGDLEVFNSAMRPLTVRESSAVVAMETVSAQII